MSEQTITEAKALLREVASGEDTATHVAWAISTACPITVGADDVAEAAEALRALEANDLADSAEYDADTRYNSRDGRHEAFLAEHDDTLQHFLGRITGQAPLATRTG